MWEDTDGADPEAERVRKVGSALRNICLNEFGSTWSNDVAEKFAKAAIAASSTPAADEAFQAGHHAGFMEGAGEFNKAYHRIEALRAATAIAAAKIASGDGFLWNGKNVTAQDYMLNICPLIERYLEGEE